MRICFVGVVVVLRSPGVRGAAGHAGGAGQLSGYWDSDRPAPPVAFYRTRHCNALPVVDTLVEAARITIARVGMSAVTANLSARTGTCRAGRPHGLSPCVQVCCQCWPIDWLS
ncbi:hypothetical protein GCM10023084_80640 [Streptomyces lacrimifluminis]|uniref:Uncharacterized protein n=1 Tax=Streptomyces lacrimifluminis TaxID=1500077 RepID=A0A917PCK7_9ACTN|nr:hypothetical protein GCM10012282_79860 [Streptomyces lacrimifluminis]